VSDAAFIEEAIGQLSQSDAIREATIGHAIPRDLPPNARFAALNMGPIGTTPPREASGSGRSAVNLDSEEEAEISGCRRKRARTVEAVDGDATVEEASGSNRDDLGIFHPDFDDWTGTVDSAPSAPELPLLPVFAELEAMVESGTQLDPDEARAFINAFDG